MKTIDRLILGALAVGVWTLVAIQVTSNTTAYAASIDASEVDGLRRYVVRIVEDCSVNGDVYLYSEDYGELDGVYISC